MTVLEAHVYPGGCAGTFYHRGYHFDAGRWTWLRVFTVDPKVWNAHRTTKREAFLLAGSRRRSTSQRFIQRESARRVMT